MMTEMLFMDELSIEGGHNSEYVATLLKKSDQSLCLHVMKLFTQALVAF